MWIMLALWFVFGILIHVFVETLNAIRIMGFPVGYYMAAQGSLIAFVIMLFLFSSRQDSIDRQEGVNED
jgi:putative solute:sodium symporter small subunit